MADGHEIKDLIARLRGEYRIPITDGLGPAGGAEPDNAHEFVRHFPTVPIQMEAAAALEAAQIEIERLNGALERAISGWSRSQDRHLDALDRIEKAEATIAEARA